MVGFCAKLFGWFQRGTQAPPPGPGVAAPTLQTHLLQVAGGELGVRETSRNQGPGIIKYWAATTYPDGHDERQPWCAAGLAWILLQAMLRRWGTEAAAPFRRCRSARVADWLDWARREPGVRVVRRPLPGDIVVFKFSHIGLVAGAGEGGDFRTIECNTDDSGGREGVEVAQRRRSLRQAQAFIRLPDSKV